MTLTPRRIRKRSTACAVLLVWVFALLSGVANACLTELRNESAHVGPHTTQVGHPTQAAVNSYTADQADQAQHDVPPDQALCQKSCDASSQMLLKQPSKVDSPDQLTVASPIYMTTRGLHLALAALAAVPPFSPPPRVQFSRLAL